MVERKAVSVNGIAMFVFLLVVLALLTILGLGRAATIGPFEAFLEVVVAVAVVLSFTGFVVVGPNQSQVVTFLGRYLGTVRDNGFRWTYPLTHRERVSLRVQ